MNDNKITIINRIRFALEQLSVKNQHHDFEHICRYIAKARICRNILPATGPVSKGGDQGRDFETFRSYLRESSINDSTFIGLISSQPVAFACTLTKKDNIENKIKDDVKVITSSGTDVVDIHYFCTTDVVVSLRHKLQKWVTDEFNTKLEIHDGQAISEYLSDQDIFWIAVEFLSIPAEVFPERKDKEKNKWYDEILQQWKNTTTKPYSYADFFDIKSCIRHATFKESLKKDLPFWLEILERLLTNTKYPTMKRNIIYEISVASLRGLGSLIGHEKRLRDYFSGIPELNTTSHIEDTAILLEYCIGAFHRNEVNFGISDLESWKVSLIQKIEHRLQTTDQIGRKCSLLHILGYIYFTPGVVKNQSPEIEKALDYWIELTRCLKNAPLFPLESFADHLTQYVEILGRLFPLSNNQKYTKLTQNVDKLLSKRYGGFIAAEKCRDRAITFHKNGEIVRAIKEIHKAKVNWFAEETLTGSLLSALFLMKCYQELNLSYASKYYNLAVAYISIHTKNEDAKKYISRSLTDAALCDFSHGAFISYLELVDVALSSFSAFSKETDPTDPTNEINSTLFHVSNIRMLSTLLLSDFLSYIDDKISSWSGLKEYFKETIPLAEDTWKDKKLSELWSALEEQLLDEPFSDVGPFRRVSFSALGVNWIFECNNEYLENCLMEEFISTFQILLADLADTDLCLLRTVIEIEIILSEGFELQLEPIPSNNENRIKLFLVANPKDFEPALISKTVEIIYYASLLPKDEYYKRIETAFREGLPNKTFFGRRYKELYEYFINEENIVKTKKSTIQKPKYQYPFKTKMNTRLKWSDDSGPIFTDYNPKEALKNRYSRSRKPIKYTLQRLAQNEAFLQTISKFRKEGWLDWHILTSLAMQAVNYRVKKFKESGIVLPPNSKDTFSREKEIFSSFFDREEGWDFEEIPTIIFSEENLRMALNLSMVSTLGIIGLENHQITPDFQAISDFLGVRYNYWLDDIDHESLDF